MKSYIVSAALACAALATSPATAQTEEERERHSRGREGQWIFRDLRGDGQVGNYAMFLSWDYSSVLFRASCDKGTLALDYYGGNGAEQPDLSPITLTRSEATDERSVKSAHVEGKPGAYVAHYPVNEGLLAVLKPTKSELMIDAPMAKDDLAEPWYVGDAEPLYKVAQNCK